MKDFKVDLYCSYFILQQSLSRQSSLAEDRINSSDEDEFLEERSGTCFNYICDTQPNSSTSTSTQFLPFNHSTYSSSSSQACFNNKNNNNKDTIIASTHTQHIKHSSSTISLENHNQPDLLKEVLAQSSKQQIMMIKTSQTENDLKRLEINSIKSASFDAPSTKCESFNNLRCNSSSSSKKIKNFKFQSESIDEVKANKSLKKKSSNPIARSCVSQ